MPPILFIWRILKNPSFWALVFAPMALHWTAVEIIVFYNADWADAIRKSVWFFIPALIICGLINAWPKNKFSKKILGTDIDVAIKIGSIFSSKNPIVIGATTHFDFSLDDDQTKPSISPKSVQGQFQLKYFDRPSDVGPIIEREKRKLTSVGTSTPQEKPFGPKVNFARGEIIAVAAAQRCGYYVALSTLDTHRTAKVSLDQYFETIPRMWDELRRKGNYEPLDVPLLGGRFARTGLSLSQTLTLLVRSFVAASREGKIVDDVTFYISPKDYVKGGFTPELLERILDRECSFEKIDSRTSNNITTGVGVS